MVGDHCIKQWSKTQACVSLSSGEAELYSMVKGCTEGIGMQTVASELGRMQKLRLATDSSAAKGAAMRTGAGRLKHIQTSQLWIQEKINRGEVTVKKIPRDINTADIFTHHWSNREGASHLPRMGFYAAEGVEDEVVKPTRKR